MEKTFVNNSTVCIPHLKPARQITFLWHSIANTYRKNFMPHGNSNKQCSGMKADSTQSVNVEFIRGLYFSFFYKPGKMTVCYIPARKKNTCMFYIKFFKWLSVVVNLDKYSFKIHAALEYTQHREHEVNTEYLVKKITTFFFQFWPQGDKNKNVTIYFLLRFVLFISIYCLFLSGRPKIV